jgi:4-amino-4-deoxy-L-arabinose transferase-like glycosyltransferase
MTATDPTSRAAAERGPERTSVPGGGLTRLFTGPADDPRWARPALWCVLVLAAVLYSWALSINGDANYFYTAAVRSGMRSWKAFFFGSLDSASFVTVDKPPLSLWLMALSCRVFGYSSWSMLLPGAVAGVATVAVLYSTVRRVFGHTAAVVAALVLTLTPMTVVVDRTNQPEPLLILLLVIAAWACTEAIRTGALAPLLWSAAAVGLAFNTKMLQAYLVLPALAVAYLIAAREPLGRRIGRLALAGGALVLVSAAWLTVVDLWPKGSRPYVGGSTNNMETNLVFCYNGVRHIAGILCDTQVGFGGGNPIAANGGDAPDFGGLPGLGRLFTEQVAGQITWLLPFVVVALVTTLVLWRKEPRTDPRRAAVVLWGVWLLVHFVIFSFSSGTFHLYYTTQLAPAIAVLTGVGLVALAGLYRASGRWAWPLPAAVAVTGAWSVVIMRRTPDFVPWLTWTIAALTVLVAGGLVVLRARGPLRAPTVAAAVVAGLAAMLAGPAAYAVTPLSDTVSGYAPQAGPPEVSQAGVPLFIPIPKGVKPPKRRHPGKRPDGRPDSSGGLGQAPPGLSRYLVAHRGNATWLAATNSGMVAATLIVEAGGRPVMAMGGFGGLDPILSVDRVAKYVRDGRLHYFLLDTSGPWAGTPIAAWLRKNCPAIDPAQYGPRTPGSNYRRLYRCD